MQLDPREIIVLKPTASFLSFLASQAPDIILPTLKLLQTDITAYTFPLHASDDALLETIEANFELMFQKRKPSLVNIPSISMEKLPIESTYSQFLLTAKLVKSRGEAKRLILQKAVEHNDKLVVGDTVPKFKKQDIIKVGKKNFIKIV